MPYFCVCGLYEVVECVKRGLRGRILILREVFGIEGYRKGIGMGRWKWKFI
jgi:hypothetical protein